MSCPAILAYRLNHRLVHSGCQKNVPIAGGFFWNTTYAAHLFPEPFYDKRYKANMLHSRQVARLQQIAAPAHAAVHSASLRQPAEGKRPMESTIPFSETILKKLNTFGGTGSIELRRRLSNIHNIPVDDITRFVFFEKCPRPYGLHPVRRLFYSSRRLRS